ncbi:MAG: retroviral-like aspartic protease family protein [Lachnospiraceae bacterium]|jgi:predicted aspartyl protease|nr:retroviral-like aspartic protease family protein [Lachnospiraceae bacterium]
MMNVFFEETKCLDLLRQDGLFHVTLHIVYEGSPVEGDKLKLILDTGAYITVISRGTAINCGFDKLPKKAASIFGFGGDIKADYVHIPGLLVSGKLHTNVPVMIPHKTHYTDVSTGETKQTPEVLGLNILEHYNYYIDTENDKLYLRDNPKPRFYAPELESGATFAIGL